MLSCATKGAVANTHKATCFSLYSRVVFDSAHVTCKAVPWGAASANRKCRYVTVVSEPPSRWTRSEPSTKHARISTSQTSIPTWSNNYVNSGTAEEVRFGSANNMANNTPWIATRPDGITHHINMCNLSIVSCASNRAKKGTVVLFLHRDMLMLAIDETW